MVWQPQLNVSPMPKDIQKYKKVNGDITNADVVVVYGDIEGDVTNADNVVVIGGKVKGDLINCDNAMVVEDKAIPLLEYKNIIVRMWFDRIITDSEYEQIKDRINKIYDKKAK